jgi:raffinose/stachyose/melibiose transport system permease protein
VDLHQVITFRKRGIDMESSLIRKYKHIKFLLYILPALLVWFILGLLPNLQIFYLAFYKWNGISKVKKYVGLDNFKQLLSDPNLMKVIYNTGFYILFLMVIQTVLAVLLAVILKKSTTHNNFFRTLIFSPIVLSTIMVGMTWGYMYDPNLGVINSFLDLVGLHSLQMNWLAIPRLSILCIVLVHIWHNMGIPLTLVLAGVQTIPNEIYESASVEGANAKRVFFSITLPLLMPTLMRVLLLTIIGGSLAFDYVYTMGSSLVANDYDTLAVYMYRAVALGGGNVGRPSAVGVILALFIFTIFIIQYIFTKKVEDSYN